MIHFFERDYKENLSGELIKFTSLLTSLFTIVFKHVIFLSVIAFKSGSLLLEWTSVINKNNLEINCVNYFHYKINVNIIFVLNM